MKCCFFTFVVYERLLGVTTTTSIIYAVKQYPDTTNSNPSVYGSVEVTNTT